MIRVLLIQPPLYFHEYYARGSAHTASILPPLGLAYMAALLIRHGYVCEIIDATALQMPVPDIVARARGFDVIGITSISTYVARVFEIIRAIKDAGITAPVIVGGPHATILPDEVLRTGADYVIRERGK